MLSCLWLNPQLSTALDPLNAWAHIAKWPNCVNRLIVFFNRFQSSIHTVSIGRSNSSAMKSLPQETAVSCFRCYEIFLTFVVPEVTSVTVWHNLEWIRFFAHFCTIILPTLWAAAIGATNHVLLPMIHNILILLSRCSVLLNELHIFDCKLFCVFLFLLLDFIDFLSHSLNRLHSVAPTVHWDSKVSMIMNYVIVSQSVFQNWFNRDLKHCILFTWLQI